ncbi:hypothetical protein [Bombilactobacillus bombi]|nr:hypothetical protein [Bombilactobacillus bombi]
MMDVIISVFIALIIGVICFFLNIPIQIVALLLAVVALLSSQ